jgi:hypothetical protein
MATDPLSTTLFALADPTRRGILAQLAPAAPPSLPPNIQPAG